MTREPGIPHSLDPNPEKRDVSPCCHPVFLYPVFYILNFYPVFYILYSISYILYSISCFFYSVFYILFFLSPSGPFRISGS